MPTPINFVLPSVGGNVLQSDIGIPLVLSANGSTDLEVLISESGVLSFQLSPQAYSTYSDVNGAFLQLFFDNYPDRVAHVNFQVVGDWANQDIDFNLDTTGNVTLLSRTVCDLSGGNTNPRCPGARITKINIVVSFNQSGSTVFETVFENDPPLTQGYFGSNLISLMAFRLIRNTTEITIYTPANVPAPEQKYFPLHYLIQHIPNNPSESPSVMLDAQYLSGGNDAYSFTTTFDTGGYTGTVYISVYWPTMNVYTTGTIPLINLGGRWYIQNNGSTTFNGPILAKNADGYISSIEVRFEHPSNPTKTVLSGKLFPGYLSMRIGGPTGLFVQDYRVWWSFTPTAAAGKLNFVFQNYEDVADPTGTTYTDLIYMSPLGTQRDDISSTYWDLNKLDFTVNGTPQEITNLFIPFNPTTPNYVWRFDTAAPISKMYSNGGVDNSITNMGVSLGSYYPGGEVGNPVFGDQSPSILACLLKGTILYAKDGSRVPIEFIKEGDTVMTVAGPKKVLEVGHWVVPWEAKTHMNNKAMFRVEKGTLGAEENVYLSYWHQVRCADGVMRPAAASRLPRAKKEEICEPGSSVYHLYHVCVEDYATSHLIVNGGCIVESWSGGGGPQTQQAKIEVARAPEEIVSF
jgi:hypothetical protein